jgi:2-polyprenyl-3-methyl-5-hydroxy-6-metoxy-1,4-benzoquinol methylase
MFNTIFKDIKKLLIYSGFAKSEFEVPDYHFKPDFFSTHKKAIDLIKYNSKVLDIGCNDGAFLKHLKENKNCEIFGIDNDNKEKKITEVINHNLDDGLPDIDFTNYDYITMLDVIEHLNKPESFIKNLKKKIDNSRKTKVIFSTPNIAFLPLRISLLFGNFNYSSKGILDYTHKRLFTFFSFRNMLIENNLKIENVYGIPAPFPLVISSSAISSFLLTLNSWFIKINKKLFSFQMVFVVSK